MVGIKWFGLFLVGFLLVLVGLALSAATVQAGEIGEPTDCPPAGSVDVELQLTTTNILLDLDQPPDGVPDTAFGAAIFIGPAAITFTDCGDGVIQTEIVSMELCGNVQGTEVCIEEDPQQASTGTVEDLDLFDSSFFPASSSFGLFWQLFSPHLNQTLHNCGGADVFEAASSVNQIPPLGAEYEFVGGDLEMCGSGNLGLAVGPVAMTLSAVGGIVEFLGDDANPSAPADSSPSSGFDYVPLAAGLAAAVVALGVGGWYIRARWLS